VNPQEEQTNNPVPELANINLNHEYDSADTGAVPHINSAQFDKSPPGITVGVWAIILAVLVPIAGFVLGIIAIIKGFDRPSNSTLGVMGIGAVILSIVVTILSIIILTLIGT